MSAPRLSIRTLRSWTEVEEIIPEWRAIAGPGGRPDVDAKLRWKLVDASLYFLTARLDDILVAAWPCAIQDDGVMRLVFPLAADLGLTLAPCSRSDPLVLHEMYLFLASAGDLVYLRGVQEGSHMSRMLRRTERRPYWAAGDTYLVALTRRGAPEVRRRAWKAAISGLALVLAPWTRPRPARGRGHEVR